MFVDPHLLPHSISHLTQQPSTLAITRQQHKPVGTVAKLRAGQPASFPDRGKSPDWLWGPSASHWTGNRGSFPRAKWLGREADYTPSTAG